MGSRKNELPIPGMVRERPSGFVFIRDQPAGGEPGGFIKMPLTGRHTFGLTRKFALGKIDRFAAAFAVARFVEFIRKNFDFFAALGAFAGKRFQISKVFEARAMLRCRHEVLLDSEIDNR